MAASACTSDNDSSSTSTEVQNHSSHPTLTNPGLQPPSQEGESGSDRPKVVFDPCTWISDDTVTAAGFDPASRKRAHDQVTEFTSFTCRFQSDLRSLDVDSLNVSFEEDQAKNSSWLHKTATVNGREAAYGQDPAIPGSCEVHLRTKSGTVFINTLLTLNGRGESADPCENINSIAAAVESSIGKDN
ncbi:DUF3558 domain-containing protein [Nocardia sp. NPDC052254]|uniref:DUF3558 domain-containing protein n=1 Tax=Nocardia sp. NPDC052254 TaxID=3155681 RepID=UPI003432B6C3